ncbi:hypothetical protein WK57_11305 [Burkholderia ubonensis]|uniref:Uncharacterized protein n=1 Tax=Burkholderia ubonensis TaxID=101571 RepID=A0AA40RD92_9BURK|nr:hypothetical protein [Burkholderia ubonensis]KVD43405.1 hypothetical protein WI85_28295 [Burkholderia ubonensis]KWZ61088.1 hypothetical protein WK57_11305 [Burkholderia ubonensis]
MNETSSSTVVKAALGTAFAALIALAAITHLDEPLKRAAYNFGWAVPFLAGYIALNYAAAHIAKAGKHPDRLVRFTRIPCFVVGSIFWLQGATAVLQHFPIPPIQIVTAKAVFAIVVTIAAVAMMGGRNKSEDD